MNSLIGTILSHDDTNIMLVAILSLFLVLLFVTLLHCYAKWFLAQGGRSSLVLVVPPVLGAHRLHILHDLLTVDSNNDNDLSPSIKGLESSVVSSIPVFVFRADEEEGSHGLECVICLSLFENEEKGRKLALCHHVFHVECIDMWLHSHTTCPICRAPAVQVSAGGNDVMVDSLSENHETNLNEQNYEEFFETSSSLGETRLSNEDPSRLEIVVEVPNTENGSDETCQRKVHPSSDNVDEFDI
ncbi:hypothetical protein Pfo_018325 [Paulownia fortunei]|nr:hypothetical protein Pfo_018325 [Paulownia fortunei]